MFYICVYEPCIKIQHSFCTVNEISTSLSIARSNVSGKLLKSISLTSISVESSIEKRYPNFKSPGQCLRCLAARSRASTLRSESNPMGRSDSEAVRNGNILACRCFILLLLASCKGCWWLMEQPSTSTMEYMPCFQHLMALVSVRKMVLSLADYGSPTLKRTNLYSSNLFKPARPMHFFVGEVWSRMLNPNQQICNFVEYKVLDKKNFPLNVWNVHSRDLFANIGPKMR